MLLFWLSPTVQANEDRLFPTPENLRPAVAFWTKVYTQSDDTGGYIHDNRHLNIVYDEIHFPKDADRRYQQREIRRSVRHWRAVLLNLAGGKRTDLSRDEQRILAIWGKQVDDKTLRAAADRIRSSSSRRPFMPMRMNR